MVVGGNRDARRCGLRARRRAQHALILDPCGRVVIGSRRACRADRERAAQAGRLAARKGAGETAQAAARALNRQVVVRRPAVGEGEGRVHRRAGDGVDRRGAGERQHAVGMAERRNRYRRRTGRLVARRRSDHGLVFQPCRAVGGTGRRAGRTGNGGARDRRDGLTRTEYAAQVGHARAGSDDCQGVVIRAVVGECQT